MAEPVPGTILGGARMTDRVVVPFEGAGAGAGGLTWGQRKVWTLMQQAGTSMSMGGAVPVTDGRTVQDLAAELRFFMCRYASMRARIRTGADGGPVQEVAGSGQAVLGIVDSADGADPDLAARELAERWEATPFDHAEEWPIRMAAVRSRGRVTHVVVTISHVATDGGGIAVMLRELGERDPATGQPAGPAPATGPLELAALQGAPSARRQNDVSLRHWERLLRAAGPRRFGPRVDRGEPRYRLGVFTSRALHLASRAVAARTGDSTSSVLLAGYALAVARLTGISPMLIQVVVSNRFRPGLAGVSHPLSVNGLFMVDTADATFDEVVDRTRRASALCSKHAYYDPAALDELRARIDRERGEVVETSCLFNDRRLDLGVEPPGQVPPSAQELADARAVSSLRWGKPFPTYLDKLMVQVGAAGDAVELEIQVDTHHVSADEVHALMLDLEAVVVAAALDPDTPTGLSAAQVEGMLARESS
ncbi:condensation domain-containing protein [Streptomyces cocklensis]|uniref:Condensation domain-containing protein n=1 Tax=Actinacidiphila cocklensis TaxID=887465 RepID=A0A9W4DSB4_9ACTN|nr:condensation domain-containing protein [Actinacidiphila cocklensis]MDD1057161.1 condensation domain-containing protein [Actinacidiphila cocklensis]CAG6395102.1 Condensation domain-containing protein [Actinacidiphila cocklensis]